MDYDVRAKRTSSASITCQPTPRLRTECGIGVALAYLDTAIKPPVDCQGETKCHFFNVNGKERMNAMPFRFGTN